MQRMDGMDLLDKLNEQQKAAVLHTTGPLLILAGAGSGKTRVITHRIAYLIRECGVSPYRILAITFTNKAAKEMQERVASLLEAEAADVWISTFHSACVRMLRRFGASLGFGQNFVIYDTDDQKRAMRDVLKHLNIDPKKLPPKQVLAAISSAKNELIGPNEFRDSCARADRDIARAYEAYQAELKKNNAMDFDDLLMNTVEMLKTDHEALAYYQNRFEHILVDEYQDTNTAQFAFIRLLATHINDEGEPEHNLCVVGDDDQSIYRFRGANIRNILDFEQSYPNAKVIKLEQNYRSTKRILEGANSVIARNLGRKSKALWSDNEDGELIRVTEYPSDIDEARDVVSEIARETEGGSAAYRDYAILYRTNAQSRAFEEQMVLRGIPYKLVGGTNFYERMEVRDILAYLRIIDNGDAMSVKRVINVPRRGIGDTTVERLDDFAYIKDIPLYRALLNVDEISTINSRAAGLVRRFTEIIEELRAGMAAPGYRLPQLVDDILEATNYEEDLREQDPEKVDERMDNIRELKSKMAQYEQNSPDGDLAGFLAEVALVADIDAVDSGDDYVVLMTLHSAKGLEFNYVYIGGMEEGLFPSHMALEADSEERNRENLEEERRLCYVGITRARKKISLSYADQRMQHGEMQFNQPSRFLSELPRELVKKRMASSFEHTTFGSRNSLQGSGRYGESPVRRGSLGDYSSGRTGSDSYRRTRGYSDARSGSAGASYSTKRSGYDYGNPYDTGRSSYSGNSGDDRFSDDIFDILGASTGKPSKPSAPYKNPYASRSAASSSASGTSAGAPDYAVGDRVRHVKFGVGTVKEIVRGSTDYHVTVDFPSGVKQMLASFAKLVKVES